MRPIAIVLLLASSSTVLAQGQRLSETLQFNDRNRSYNLYVPSTYNAVEPMPLVLNFHGLTGSGSRQESASGMNRVAEQNGFIVAYPSAVGGDWGNSPDHNIGFTHSLLDTIEAAYTVDSQRVFATGFSQGGIMSHTLGAAIPDRLAAIAPVGGTRVLSGESNRHPAFVPNTPERTLPVLHIHGTSDDVVPYDGGSSIFGPGVAFPAVGTVLEEWVSNNGGQLLEPATTIPELNLTESAGLSLFNCVDCETYTTAAGDERPGDVVHLRVNGWGHSWPNSNSLIASEAIWSFFSQHELSVPSNRLGDLDQNGIIDVADIDSLSTEIRRGMPRAAFDLDGSGSVDEADLTFMIETLVGTSFGDANLDGEFNSSDLVEVFGAGEYDDGIPENSNWAEGDWNSDGDFDSGDLVVAFAGGAYEQELQVNAVPEPSSLLLVTLAIAATLAWRRS